MPQATPLWASRLIEALEEHITPETSSSYRTAVRQFVEFCKVRNNLHPFPVNRYWLACWILYKVGFISVDSLGMYLAGVRDQHELLGHAWELEGDPILRRVMRYVKKKFGSSGTRVYKLPITLFVILRMARFLSGWPRLEDMSHNDRVWLTASVIGTTGMLRGGEFLFTSRSSREVLRGDQVVVDKSSVVVTIVKPKAQWWEHNMRVRCFSPGDPDCVLDPVRLLRAYRDLSMQPLRPHDPAFQLEGGLVLSKHYMLRRTEALLALAGIEVTDPLGQVISPRASSWRSGGVESGRAANISDPVLMAMGRWSSNAWTRYTVASFNDLQGAAQLMWQGALGQDAEATRMGTGAGRLVGSFESNGLFRDLSLESTVLERARPNQSTHTTEVEVPNAEIDVGDVIETEWGSATVVELHDDGDLECSWPDWSGTYRLRIHEYSPNGSL